MLNKINICNGTVYYTTDLNLVMMESQNPSSKIIYIDDEVIEPLRNNQNVILAGVLLPSYDSICALEDQGDPNMAFMLYNRTLDNYFPKIMNSILASMAFYGTHILFYTPPHISTIVSYINEYIMKNYGIIAGTEQYPFNYDYGFDNINIGNLYLSNAIGFIDLLYSTSPMGFAVYSEVVKKLILDIDPAIPNKTWDEYVRYFGEYQSSIQFNSVPLRSPIGSID